jgi:hypothetical protein
MKMAYTHMRRDALKLCKELDRYKNLSPLHAIQALRGREVYSSYSFFPSALDVGERSASLPGLSLPPGNGPPVPIG